MARGGHVKPRDLVTDSIVTRHFSSNCLAASTKGRAAFAAGFWNEATVTAKFGASAIAPGVVKIVDNWNWQAANYMRVPNPVASQDAATKGYVDDEIVAAITGLDWKDAVRVATAAVLPAYTRTDNVITAAGNGALAAVDGVVLVLNDRLLLKDGAAGADNGLYYVSRVGDGGTPYTLTRTNDADINADVTAGLCALAQEGTANADRMFALTTNDPIVLNTTALTFTEITGLYGVTAGTGLSSTGNTMNIEEWAVRMRTTVIAGGNGVGNVGDLNTSPVDVVAAPGANKIIVVEDVTYKFVYATAAYDGAGAGDDLVLRYSAGARAEVTGDVDNGHGGAIRFARAGAGTDYAYLKAIVGDTIPEVNTSVELLVRNNDPFTAAGGGSLEVTVTYRIIDVS